MKLTRRSALLSTAAAAALPVSARAQKASDTLRIQFVDAVPNVDMYYNSQRTGLILAHHAWDMLVHRDPATFESKPLLATEWKFAEDNSLDLTIRQGVKFHDGSTLSADDVVYTLNMAADPASKVATPSNYAWIDKAEKTGDFAVRIKMKRPTPAALATAQAIQGALSLPTVQQLPPSALPLFGVTFQPTTNNGDIFNVFDRDELLTHATIYWAGNAIGSSIRTYANNNRYPWTPAHARTPAIETPTGITFVDDENPPGINTSDERIQSFLGSDRARWYNHSNITGPNKRPMRSVPVLLSTTIL